MYNILGYDRNSEIFAAVPRSRLTINTAILARVAIGFYSKAKFWEDSISLEERVLSTARSDSRLTDPILFLDKGEQACFFQSGQGCQECHLHDTRMPADLYTPGNGRAIHHLREAQ